MFQKKNSKTGEKQKWGLKWNFLRQIPQPNSTLKSLFRNPQKPLSFLPNPVVETLTSMVKHEWRVKASAAASSVARIRRQSASPLCRPQWRGFWGKMWQCLVEWKREGWTKRREDTNSWIRCNLYFYKWFDSASTLKGWHSVCIKLSVLIVTIKCLHT